MAVTSQKPQFTAMIDEWQEMEDALIGPRAILEGGITYLPKTSGMIEAESLAATDNSPLTVEQAKQLYLAYKRRAEYPLWVKDSLRTMIGLVSRQEPEIVLPDRMKALEHEATCDGFGLKQLYLRIVSDLLTKGRKPLLAEFDDAGNPYIATYTAETAPNWLTSNVGGRQDLTLVVFSEKRLKEGGGADEFKPEYETVYRVLDLIDNRYRVRILNEAGNPIEAEEYPGLVGGSQSTPLNFIPVVFAGSTDNNPDVDETPLQTMAKAALKYYQLSADYYAALHYTAHPQPWISGMGADDDIRVTGPMAAWMLPKDAQAGYLEFQGAGIEALRKAMQDQQNAAAESGAKVIDIGGQESGEARKARQADQHSALYSVCITAAEAVEQQLKYIAYWMGIDPDLVTFKVEPEFSVQEVDAAMLQVVSNIVLSGDAPRAVLYDALRKIGLTDLADDQLDIMREGGEVMPRLEDA
ncbi:DUF4055 domain-containing protein [Halomonas sp. 707B3]|uniref:DUF4055 domain-containing protein n=1 Tax=Halomonas sp. 707B3 TaxID=1681043 RepID=UPI00209F0100|nr:DUF4055 domain-containing protein [Halomonas sp. 707B3]MCP1316376.1 DUF4055 domain-containing protein [Halomonas sp. 707B3]